MERIEQVCERRAIPIGKLVQNNGQIDGVPKNPRTWEQGDVERLAKSIEETPELLDARGLIVVPHGGKFVVIGGNMRLAACRSLKLKELPCMLLPEDTDAQKLKAIAIKDNGCFGGWDFEALKLDDWDPVMLEDWGVNLPIYESDEKSKKETEKLSELKFDTPYYEPKKLPNITLKDCVNLDKFEAKVRALDEYNLTKKQKEVLKLFAYRFIKIDFESVANYYAFNASEEEKKALERLRLVLVDGGVSTDSLKTDSLT